MLKSLLNLEGAQALNTKEKKSINGGCPSTSNSCWIVCPRAAPAICDPYTVGIYECDCNCY